MLGVFALGLAASLFSYKFEVHNIVRDLHERTLEAQARELLAALHIVGGNATVTLPADWRKVYRDPARQFTYTIFDQAHRPVSWSPNLVTPLPYMPLGATDRLGPVDFIGVGAQRRAVLAAHARDGYVALVARSGLSRDTLVDSLFEEDTEHLLILVPFALLALGLIWLISGWSLRPIERASREAALVGPGKPETRISAEGLPQEIRPLVDAVNGALDRLSRAYAAERRLTADAAHELRTPLAVLNLRLQRARLSGITDWPALEHELSQMSRLVNQLLDLARKESLTHQDRAVDLPVINLSRVIREAAAMVVPLIEAQGRRLDVEIPDNMPVHGRAEDLHDMFRNLLDNAIVHGSGTVKVTLRTTFAASKTVLEIEVGDEGEGVPRGQEEAVFERFRKLKAESPGSGLGLAIVRQVARSHGGDARFCEGRGSIVLTLPGIGQPTALVTSQTG